MCTHNCYHYLESLLETFFEFAQNSSIPGYKYLTGKNGIERLFWYVVHFCILIFTYFLVTYNWEQFTTNPTITTLETYSYPISKIPLPGISICTINKISKIKAEAYATNLANRSGKTYNEIYENIKLFGRFYDFNLAPHEEEIIIQFQNFLGKFDSDKTGIFNTHKTLQSLTYSCSELISDCKWKGDLYNCEDLFITELTMEGVCCVFNYYTEKSISVSKILKENNLKSLKSDSYSRSGGLSLKIYSNVSDYMYTTIATVGTKVLLSLPTDYPDTWSGGLIEKLISIGVEVFLKISSSTTITTSEVKKYPIEKRQCIFRNERTTLFGGYSFSDCIVDCKIKSIVALCRCVPFTYVNVFTDSSIDQCTLADLKCLSSYNNKWKTMYPEGVESDELEREKQDSLYCKQCVPTCSDTTYTVQSEKTSISYANEKKLNYSIMHVFFEKPSGILNKQDVYFYWFDIISLFGGICSLMMGISIISVVECVYYFIYEFYLKLMKNVEQRTNYLNVVFQRANMSK